MIAMPLIIAAVALSGIVHGSPASPHQPTVVRTSPREGATLKPGPFVVSVTFDRAMQPGSYSFAGPRDLAPEACGTPELSKDGRTYSMRCNASPGRQYEIWFNREPYMNFRSADGISAKPHRLTFSVSAK
jgi:hypothetical protein